MAALLTRHVTLTAPLASFETRGNNPPSDGEAEEEILGYVEREAEEIFGLCQAPH